MLIVAQSSTYLISRGCTNGLNDNAVYFWQARHSRSLSWGCKSIVPPTHGCAHSWNQTLSILLFQHRFSPEPVEKWWNCVAPMALPTQLPGWISTELRRVLQADPILFAKLASYIPSKNLSLWGGASKGLVESTNCEALNESGSGNNIQCCSMELKQAIGSQNNSSSRVIKHDVSLYQQLYVPA